MLLHHKQTGADQLTDREKPGSVWPHLFIFTSVVTTLDRGVVGCVVGVEKGLESEATPCECWLRL